MISLKISKFIKAFPSSTRGTSNANCLILNQKKTCSWDSEDIPNSSITFSFKPFYIKLEQYLLYVSVDTAPINGWAVEGSNDKINFDTIQEKEEAMCTKMSGILCIEGNDRIETVSTSKSYRYIRIRATKKRSAQGIIGFNGFPLSHVEFDGEITRILCSQCKSCKKSYSSISIIITVLYSS